jgi:4-amino-4-deoxy-L-arabinose transferase-like glycosyltransferase
MKSGIREDVRGTRVDPVLVVLLACAAALRLWQWDSIALDHFDEGAYAVSARAIAEGLFPARAYPLQHLLSPPLHFIIAGVTMLFVGISDRVLVGVSVCLGTATVGLVYAFTRTAFGRAAALGAAAMVGLADYQVLYSRSGLTDVGFGFWFVVALWCFAESERRESWSWAALAGVATGFAWNTKYHGWLAVVIALAAVAMGARESGRSRLNGALGRIVVGGAIALALYLPWAAYISLQPGGYARMAAEYSQYLRPLQAPQQVWAQLQAGRGAHKRALRVASLVAALGAILGAAVFSAVAAVWGVVIAWGNRDAGARIALAFLGAFAVLTPLYYPYPRLALPWMLGSSVFAGVAIADLISPRIGVGAGVARPRVPPLARSLAGAGVAAIIVLVCWVRPPWVTAHTFRPKDGFRTAASRIATRLPEDCTVLVWAEPAVVFYLRDRLPGVYAINDIREASRYAALGRPIYLVTSLYAGRLQGALGLPGWSSANPGALSEVDVAPVRALSDVRLMDDFGPSGSSKLDRAGMDAYDLHLFRVVLPQ